MNNNGERAEKRAREEAPTLNDLMVEARRIWKRNKDPSIAASAQTEDRTFWEFFGCGPFVLFAIWSRLIIKECLPEGGTMEKLLWSYLYMKVYAKMAVLCVLCGGIDTKTLRKWVWLFITAVAEMEPGYVRDIVMLVCVSCLLLFTLTSVSG